MGAPRLTPGRQLLGAYQGSGSSEVPYLVRRADGTMVQLPRLLYEVAAGADGRSIVDSIASRVGGAMARSVTADDVAYLIGEASRPA